MLSNANIMMVYVATSRPTVNHTLFRSTVMLSHKLCIINREKSHSALASVCAHKSILLKSDAKLDPAERWQQWLLHQHHTSLQLHTQWNVGKQSIYWSSENNGLQTTWISAYNVRMTRLPFQKTFTVMPSWKDAWKLQCMHACTMNTDELSTSTK